MFQNWEKAHNPGYSSEHRPEVNNKTNPQREKKIVVKSYAVYVLKTLEIKEIKPVNPKGSQTRIFTGRTDDEAENPIPWPP